MKPIVVLAARAGRAPNAAPAVSAALPCSRARLEMIDPMVPLPIGSAADRSVGVARGFRISQLLCQQPRSLRWRKKAAGFSALGDTGETRSGSARVAHLTIN